MSSLRELQAGFRAALLAGDERGVAPDVVDDGVNASARLAVYRHHVLTSLSAALEATFPVVCRLVDRRFFGWLADSYVRAHPPAGPCLFEYGADLPEFIAAFPARAPLPWLADVARLEWAMNVALHAPDAVPLEPEALRTLPPAALARLTLRLDPSVTLLASRWPVDAIWDANQAGVDPAPTVDLDAGGAWLEIRRRDGDVVDVDRADADGLAVADDAALGGGGEAVAVERDLAPCQGATQSAEHSAGHAGHDVVERGRDGRALGGAVVLAQRALHTVDDGLGDVTEVGVARAVLVHEVGLRDVFEVGGHGHSSSVAQRAQRRQRCLGLGTGGVVGIALRGADDPATVDHESRRHRQGPRSVAVVLRDVERKRGVDGAQVIRQRERQPEPRGDGVAAVGEDREAELAAADQLTVVLGQLRRERHQG